MMLFYERPVNKTQSKEHNQLCMPKHHFVLRRMKSRVMGDWQARFREK